MAAKEVNVAALVVVATCMAAFGYEIPWPDPARAGYILQWCGWIMLCAGVYLCSPRRLVRLMCAASIGVASAGALCASWWPLLSQIDGVCDEATGRPVTAGVALAVLAMAAEILRSGHGRSSG